MLLSLAVLAVVGGSLAFKAKYGGLAYCTTLAIQVGQNFICPPSPTCPFFNDRLTDFLPTIIYCTAPSIYDAVNDKFTCFTTPDLPCPEISFPVNCVGTKAIRVN
jgi:hypothetical protein